MAQIALLGRRGFQRGRVTGRAQGNAQVTSDVRGDPAARPGATPGIPPAAPLPLTTAQQASSRFAYAGPAFHNGRRIVSDRHIIERTGHTTTSANEQTPRSGIPNPEADGPARPAGTMVNRTISWQIGTDSTRGLDNAAPHASVALETGRKFPLSSQGTGPQPVYGGTPGLIRPYGARGTVIGPPPKVKAMPGGPYPAGITLTPGSKTDGPQDVFGGAPHGLHSPTLAARKQTLSRYRAVPQMVPGRVTRPANSKIAGQSMSQFVVPLSGRGGGPPPTARGGAQPGVTGRFVTRNTRPKKAR